jgi:hypothetical protein
MIRYALACDKGHAFESWFQNSAAYNKQVKAGLVVCPVCSSAKVEKTIMAPREKGFGLRQNRFRSKLVGKPPPSIRRSRVTCR